MAANDTNKIGDAAQNPMEGDGTGLTFARHFTKSAVHPFDKLEWERRDAAIYNEKGNVIFKQDQVEVPTFWTQLATDIAASKYFRKAGVPDVESEDSVRQLVTRVARTLRRAGRGSSFPDRRSSRDRA